MREHSAETSGFSQNSVRVFLFCNSANCRNLLVSSGDLTGFRSLSPSSLTRFLLTRSNREGILLGVHRRGAHSSLGREKKVGNFSQVLDIFPQEKDTHIGNEFRFLTDTERQCRISFVCGIRGWRDGGSGVILVKEIKVSVILDEKILEIQCTEWWP